MLAGLHSLGDAEPKKFLPAIATKFNEILAKETEIVVKARIKLALEQLIVM